MPIKKRNWETVWQLTFDIMYLNMSLKEAAKLNNMSVDVANKAFKEDAVSYKYITKQQYSEYLRKARLIGYNGLKKKFHSEEELSVHYSKMGSKSAVKCFDDLEKRATNGGLATQAKHAKKVGKNLRHAKHYGSTACKYDDVLFHSEGERVTALLLKEYGLITDIKVGENFQKAFGRMRVDFYISDKLIVEYHPPPKQRFSTRSSTYDTLDGYVQERIEHLKPYFNGDIVFISPVAGKFAKKVFYNKLESLGIQDTWAGFLEKCADVRKSIDLAEKQYELDLKNRSSEEKVPF